MVNTDLFTVSDKPFYLDEYIENVTGKISIQDVARTEVVSNNKQRFQELCDAVKAYFHNQWQIEDGDDNKSDKYTLLLERQKKAIIGHKNEVAYFKDQIDDFLKMHAKTGEWFPKWYPTLTDAIFHENWGLAGLSEWFFPSRKELMNSSSAKVIGDRIYFFINGRQVLQPQSLSQERRKQLLKALLLKTPSKRINEDQHDLYALDGTRISIYGEGLSKEGQESFVFRKYFVKDYTFEKQAEFKTIPYEAIPLFKAMVKVGFNVTFTGPVRTAKSTFLSTWQSYENPTLEGVMIETDPEIPMHDIMPNAPIMQVVASGERLQVIMKDLLRSDADYMLMAEARDATSFYIMIEVADRGTRRIKSTAHFSRGIDFSYNVAKKITEEFGGDPFHVALKVSQNINYIFEFVQLRDRSKKRLKGILEQVYDPVTHEVSIHQICKYDFANDTWSWNYHVGKDKQIIGEEEDADSLAIFEDELRKLAEEFPMGEEFRKPIIPAFSFFSGRGGSNGLH